MAERKTGEAVELEWKKLSKCVLDPRSAHASCSSSDLQRMYMFGGRSRGGANNEFLTLSLGDDLIDGWVPLKPSRGEPPCPRKSCAMACIGNKVYIFGGNDGRGSKGMALGDLHTYNIASATWNEIPGRGEVPCPRERHSMVVLGGQLCVFGGLSYNGEFLNDCYLFDTSTRRWTQIRYSNNSPVPKARYEHVAGEAGGLLVIHGGKWTRGGLNDTWHFNPKTKTWNQPASCQIRGSREAEGKWGSTGVMYKHYLINFGGWNGRKCFNDLTVLDCRNWKYVTIWAYGKAPDQRTFHAAAIIGNSMVCTAGRNLSRRMDDTHVLELAALKDFAQKTDRTQKALAELEATPDPSPEPSGPKVTAPSPPPTRNSGSRTNPATKPALPLPSKLYQKARREQAGIDWFELTTTLGTGSFGRVKLCKCKDTGEYFAMKILKKKVVLEMRQENHIKWERKILSEFKHPFIVNLEAYFQDDFNLYLVLELVQGGEFFSLLRYTEQLHMNHVVFYSAQIVLIFRFLHENRIVYRDLKPENLLIGKQGYLKLTDFGFAKRLAKSGKTYTLCGTPEYIAPEILNNKGHGPSVDWWALGILVYEMFLGHPPFVDENPMMIYRGILSGKIKYPAELPPRAKDFISKLLTLDHTRRLSGPDVQTHSFFKGVGWSKVLHKHVKAPFIPKVDGPDDTQHFDEYSDGEEDDEEVVDFNPFMDF